MFSAILFSIGAAILQLILGLASAIGLVIDLIRFGTKAIVTSLYRPVARFT